MPPIEVADLLDTAVLWAFVRMNRDDEIVLADPIEIPVRWVWHQRVATNETGNPIEITAQIATDCVIPGRSLVWYGEAKDWTDTPQELYEVVSVSRAKGIDNKFERREYDLTRFRSSLPSGTATP
jgi:hypothetical protein